MVRDLKLIVLRSGDCPAELDLERRRTVERHIARSRENGARSPRRYRAAVSAIDGDGSYRPRAVQRAAV